MSTDLAALGLTVRSDGVVVASERLDKFKGSSDKAGRGADGLGQKSKLLSGALRRLAVVAGAAAGGLLAAFSSGRAISAADQYETRTARINAILEATGGIAGKTSRQLEEQAQSLARATLESVDGVRSAQQTLLTFRNVQGDVFDRAIESAADLAAAMNTDIKSATLQLAKALEDPVKGISALSESGTTFNETQREMVKAMVEAGDTLGAQSLILDVLGSQYAGASRAAGDFASAKDSLGQSANNLAVAFGSVIINSGLVLGAIKGLDSAFQFAADNVDVLGTALQGLVVVLASMAATRIPAMIISLTSMASGLSIAAIAAGTLTRAMAALRVAVALAGGPWGILAGLITAAAGAALIFRNNAGEAETALYDAAEGSAALNRALGTFYSTAAPSAGKAAINLANDNHKLAASAFEAAKAELAKRKSMLSASEIESKSGSNRTERNRLRPDVREATKELAAAEAALNQAMRDSRRAATAVTGSMSETMSKDVQAANDLKVTVEGLDTALQNLGGGGGSGGGGGGAAVATDAIGVLQKAMENARAAQDQWAQRMAGHFDGIITGGRKASDILMGLARQLETSFWNNLFKGFGGGGSGGGIFGGLFGGGGGGKGLLGMGGFLGFLDVGGNIGANEWGVAGERRPEIVTGPSIVRGPARVIGGAQTAQMMKSGQGGGRQQIDLRIHAPEGVTIEQVGQIATGVSVQVMRSGLKRSRAALPGQITESQNRGV